MQEGELRTVQNTVSTIEQQIQLSLASGAGEKLRKSLYTTGVRDTTTSRITETLVELGKQLRKCGGASQPMPESEIRATLEKKLDEMLQGGTVRDSINPLLGMKGTFVIAVTAGH